MAEQKQGALPRLETTQCVAHGLLLSAPGGDLGRVRRALANELQWSFGLKDASFSLAPSPFAAQSVECRVGCRAPEPGVGPRILPERWPVARCLEENILGEVFGIAGVAGHPIEQAIYRAVAAAKQRLKALIALLDPCQGLFGHHHVVSPCLMRSRRAPRPAT